MKKTILAVGIVCLGLMIFICGCTQQDDGGDTAGTTVTMTAEELVNDMEMDTDWSTYITIGYTSLEEGDTLIIHDTISEIEYNSDADATKVVFIVPIDGGTSSQEFWFEGNITDIYAVGDEVQITVTIKHVTFTYESVDYDMEVYEEHWESEEYFSANMGTTLQGFKALPQSTIVKV